MKLIWLSVAPYAPTGYGSVTRNLVPRIQAEGHEVIIATKHFHCGDVEWNGMHVIQGMDVNILNRMVDRGEYDYIFSLLDNHALPAIPHKWISYTPFDTQKIPESISRTLTHPLLIIALTKHGKSEIERIGYDCLYAPHGIDTKVFWPNEERRQSGRKLLGWQDNFVIGSVGVNYEDDRKNFINLVMAFKKFHERHTEARLFLNSNPISTDGSDYLPMAIRNLGLDKLVDWAEPDKYFIGHVSDEMMADRYRRMDVFCLPTRGEGFGLPLIEAEACGVPVVTTGASTGPELCPTQYLIPVHNHEWQWFNKEWRPNVNAENILEVLEKAYQDKDRSKVGEKGREFAQDYDWNTVFETYWRPVLAEIQGLKTKVQTVPNYRKLYEAFEGRIAMSDCGQWCENKCNESRLKPFVESLALLPGERYNDRPLLRRSFPVKPDSTGKLVVSTVCPMHKWLSKKFKQDVKETWEYLWGFPVIRDYFKDKSVVGYTPLDWLRIDFDGDYKWAMQSKYHTNAPDITKYLNGDKILEVGCGDGARVKALQDKGFSAEGLDVNPAHEGLLVKQGDIEAIDALNDTYGVVYSVDVLEHLEDPLKAISEMFRVSKGLVINAITPSEDPCFWQDPTHKVEWQRERWLREIAQFGDIVDVLEPFTVIARRKK